MSNSIYDCVEQGPAIEVFALNHAYQDDTHPKKTNLGVGGKFYKYLVYFKFIKTNFSIPILYFFFIGFRDGNKKIFFCNKMVLLPTLKFFGTEVNQNCNRSEQK